MTIIRSIHNPRFASLTDSDILALYEKTEKSRNPDTMSDEELDAIESELFQLDEELCARGLDLPC